MVEGETARKTDRREGPGRIYVLLYHGLRVFLGVVFLYAGFVKILQPAAFADAVYNYQILPDAAVNLTALVLPWTEVAVGLCLMVGIWLPGAVSLSTSLLGIFIGTLIFNLIRGLDVHCGCFSAEITHGPADMFTVVRDLFFLAASLYLAAFMSLNEDFFGIEKSGKTQE